MGKGPESRLTNHIIQGLENAYKKDIFVFKVHGTGYQMTGLPDIIGCLNGYFIGLEVKLPDGKHPVSPMQHHVLNRIDKTGGVSAVVRSVSEALDAVAHLAAAPRRHEEWL